MILDTTAVIDLLKGDSNIVVKIKSLEKQNVPLLITSISVFEVWQGIKNIVDDKNLEKINSLLDSLGTFSFDIVSAKEAGLIFAVLKKEGNIIDPEDCMIAGIAKINKEIVLTRNIKHFSKIENLEAESY